MKKGFRFGYVLAALMVGTLVSSGIAAAKDTSIQASVSKLRFLVQGEDRSSATGQFDNNGKMVPEAIVYEGTTYVPVRMVSELLEQPVHWEGTTKTVWLGEVEVPIVKADGTVIGHAKLSQTDEGVRIHVEAAQLTPGKHGFHLHEKAFENNDFKTAGGHYNPDSAKHGHDNPDGHHAGDFENLVVGEDGTVSQELLAKGLTLEKGKERSIWGKSFIIHAAEDDYKSDPAGNAGDRVAGGVIQ